MAGTRERILEASGELFRRQGLTGTGIKQILDEAGAPFGSLYHHFPGGKEQLAAETIRRAGAHFGDLVAQKLLAEPDLVSGLRTAFRDAGATLEATDYADACPIETVALEVASTNDRLRRATNDVFEGWLASCAGRLEAAGVEGGFMLSRAARSPEPMRTTGRLLAELVSSARGSAPSPAPGRRASRRS